MFILMIYDIIIIGGGIAGLNVASYSNKRDSKLLIEGLYRLGGRIQTDKHKIDGKDIWFDAGAARFSKNHLNLLKLIKKLNMKKDIVPYPSKIEYSVNDGDNKMGIDYIYDAINKIEKEPVSSSDNNEMFGEFIKRMFGNKIYIHIKKTFEYGSTIDNLSLQQAKEIFENDYNPEQLYYTLNNGLGMIIDKLENVAKKNNTTFSVGTYVSNVTFKDDIYNVIMDDENIFKCNKIVFACPPRAFENFSALKENKIDLDVLNYYSLNRVYAYFKNPIWNDFERLVVGNKLTYLLSINDNIVQTSYTEGDTSKYWLNTSLDGKLEDNTIKLLKDITDLKVSKPLLIKNYHWDNALGHWKSNINYSELSEYYLSPNKNMYICTDLLSMHQDWMEGSVERSNRIINMLKKTRQNKTQRGGKLKIVSINELKKHNTRNDAWILISGKVYDITKWIDKHPGGDVILKGVGKDATQMFNNIGHSDHVKNEVLPKYLIGKIKTKKTKKKN